MKFYNIFFLRRNGKFVVYNFRRFNYDASVYFD